MEERFNKEEFLLTNEKKLFENGFINSGWITIYHSIDDGLIYSYLVDDHKVQDELNNLSWNIQPYNEGRPSVWGNGRYESYAYKGIEPFIYLKHFHFDGGEEKYVDISEEFVLYFKLYEKGNKKQNRTFYSIGDLGELEEVIRIEHEKVTVKLKYLNEYLAVRKMNFSMCFDYTKRSNIKLEDYNIDIQEIENKTDSSKTRHIIERSFGKALSWFEGKKIIKHNISCLTSINQKEYADFLTGYDSNGNEVYKDSSHSNEKYMTFVWFDKKVLNEYHSNPTKYEIDSLHVKSKFFELIIDNNLDDCIAASLVDLGKIPYKEQLHWKKYNIEPKNKISSIFHNTIMMGEWFTHPETPDLFFKHKYDGFNKSWEAKFGWKLFKPLDPKQTYRLTGLHIPVSDNIKLFCDEMLSLSILIIDRLNEEQLKKELPNTKNNKTNISKFKKSIQEKGIEIPDDVKIQNEPESKGIKKFEEYLEHKGLECSQIITFLKNLYALRSGLMAHSFSHTNKNCLKAMKHFDFEHKNYQEITRDIFIESIKMLNMLEQNLLKENTVNVW